MFKHDAPLVQDDDPEAGAVLAVKEVKERHVTFRRGGWKTIDGFIQCIGERFNLTVSIYGNRREQLLQMTVIPAHIFTGWYPPHFL